MAAAPAGKRVIKGIFYNSKKEVVRRTASVHPRTATLCAVDHLQMDHYRATVAEVFDSHTGTLHAVIARVGRKVEIIYKRDPVRFE